MIKLKNLILESIKSEKDKAAEYLIKQAWKFMPNKEERYNSDSVILWIDNERSLIELAEKLSKKFYPNNDEPWYTFQNDISRVLISMEEKRLQQRRDKTTSLKDPLYILKKAVTKKTWRGAKATIVNLLGTGGFKMRDPSDEQAELIFNRLYKNAMGETIYDEKYLKDNYGKLSDLSMKSDDTNNKDQISINIFLRHYGIPSNPKGKIRVWRGTNNPHATIRPGDFVTFDRGYAMGYMTGKWKTIVTDIINTQDLLVYKLDAGMSELVYWPEGYVHQKYDGPIPTMREFWETYRYGI